MTTINTSAIASNANTLQVARPEARVETRPASDEIKSISPAGSDKKKLLEEFDKYIKIINDKTGAYSLDQKLSAWSQAFRRQIDGSFTDSSKESLQARSLYQSFDDSEIEKLGKDLYIRSWNYNGGIDRGGCVNELNFINSLSEEEKKIYFTTTHNRPNCFHGYAQPYRSFDEWYADREQRAAAEVEWLAHPHPVVHGNDGPTVELNADETATVTGPSVAAPDSAATTLARGLRAITPTSSVTTSRASLLQLFVNPVNDTAEHGRWFTPYRPSDHTGLRQNRLA